MSDNKNQKRMRYAVYTRYSSDMQNEISLEAQEDRCRKDIAERGGAVVAVYSDGAKNGWSLDREGFNQLRADAERGRFDAVYFWKFDRLARNHDHAVMIKMLLRHEYNLKLFCVEGFSEDDDDSPYTAMMEQMLAVFSAFYSKNLSSETKRGKYQRAVNGQFNGSVPPLGYDLVTVRQSTPERPAGLHINPEQAEIVLHAFERYSTRDYSDSEIAQWMNEQPLIRELRAGKKPIGKEMVRDMLQNRTYLGYVSYCETEYSGTLGQGKRSSRNRKIWFEGKHEGFLPEQLFEECQQVRTGFARTFKTESVMRTYVLHDRVYCAHCVSNMPSGLVDENYGKMRPYWDKRREYGYYRCLCKERGYRPCPQHAIQEQLVNQQVIDVLTHLEIPDNFRERVEAAVRDRVENEAALKRMEEIREIIERIDLRWDHGFISQEEYVEKRGQLQREVEALRPIDYDEMNEAADLIQYFGDYWDGCEEMDNPAEARQQLLQKIVDQVFVYNQQVIAVALHGNFSVVLDTGEDDMPDELATVLKENGCAIIFNDAQPGRERRAWNARRLRDFWAENGLSPLRRNHFQLQASGVGWEKTRQWLLIYAHSPRNRDRARAKMRVKRLCAPSAHALHASSSRITR